MNLVKKSATLLATLSAFALVSCAGPKPEPEPAGPQEIGFLAAREWLKDAKTEEAETKMIKSEKFEWDVTVTGTGMDIVTEEGKLGGAQIVLGALITIEQDTYPFDFFDRLAVNVQKVTSLKGDFEDPYKSQESKSALDDEMAFVNQETIMDIEAWWGTYDHQHLFDEKDNLLRLVFGREEEFPVGDPAPVLNFNEEIVVTSDGYTDHWTISAENMPFKLKYDQAGVDADGTFSGTITGTFTYQTE